MGERRKTSVDRTDGKGRGQMSAAEIAVQAAAVAAMRAHAPLATAGSWVFDGQPPVVCFPYVTVGESRCVDWSHTRGRGRAARVVREAGRSVAKEWVTRWITQGWTY